MTSLWKFHESPFSSEHGYWTFCRECSQEDASGWLAWWESNDPKGIYKLSVKRPRLPKGYVKMPKLATGPGGTY